jgi:hypothetical protein
LNKVNGNLYIGSAKFICKIKWTFIR